MKIINNNELLFSSVSFTCLSADVKLVFKRRFNLIEFLLKFIDLQKKMMRQNS